MHFRSFRFFSLSIRRGHGEFARLAQAQGLGLVSPACGRYSRRESMGRSTRRGFAMFRNVFIFAGSLIGFLVSQSVSAQTPAAGTPPPSANPPPPPIADLTPVELPDRSRCNSPIDCVTCNNQPPAILTSAEYILVRPRRRENDYAIIDPTNNLTPEGSIRNVPFDTTGAFRVGAGYRPGGTPWEVMFTYMYLHDGNDRSAAAPPGGTLYATQTRKAPVVSK